MDLRERIKQVRNELDLNSINKQRKRYLESYLFELIAYMEKHPEETEEPSPLVLFCELNPDAAECRLFDV